MSHVLNKTNLSVFNNVSDDDQFGKSSSGTNPYYLIKTSLFAMVFVTGVIGNSFVISTVLRLNEMKTSCNYLIMTIAVADMGVAVLATPLRIVENYIGWPFGETVCRLLVPLQDVLVCVSVVAHTCIALERYRAIVTPFKQMISRRKMKFVIIGLWIGCYIALALPVAPLLAIVERNKKIVCKVLFPSKLYKRVFMMSLVSVFIVIPLLIQTCSYCCIARCLGKKTLISESCSGLHQKRKRMIKMLLTSVVIFDICYLPRGILMVLYMYGDRTTFPPEMKYINVIALVMYYVKHVINPVILFAMSADFRAGFCALCKRGQSENSQNTSSKRTSSNKLQMTRLSTMKKSADEQQNPIAAALLENTPNCNNH
ncbi:hypothetical protein QZH41_001740 [Actinostola sp. cb2023]|nr:hypothetical protein QZH41_001740 [Actinostola sp. cb2023]